MGRVSGDPGRSIRRADDANALGSGMSNVDPQHANRDLADRLLADPAIGRDAFARELAVVMAVPTRRTARGHPYLQEPAWTRLRDWVPHILDDGPRALGAAERVASAARAAGVPVDDAAQVVRQVVLSAAVTAPPDLWLLRSVLAACHTTGLSARFLAGEVVHAEAEQRIDLRFLLSRGLVRLSGDGTRIADHRAARDAFERTGPLVGPATSWAEVWRAACDGRVTPDARALLLAAYTAPVATPVRAPGWFAPSASAIERGARLVPLVLGLRAAGRIPALLDAARVDAAALCADASLGAVAEATLRDVGALDASGALSVVGRRILERGPGPFGIIEAYQPYMDKLADIWTKGRGAVWVERGKNVAASQDANRATFEAANDALDRFCAETGFSYRVFIEHALGKGEATRQRHARKGGHELRYVGADLEDAAIDASIAERDAGRLPADMLFVRDADIGKPDVLLRALASAGISPAGAVMIVGNGFHEVREQTDARMTEVFRGYAQAGIVLLFTEETGLSVEDLLATAWNTYHAGFAYVHERSGQGLRPADERAASSLDGVRPASWHACAARGGYVRLDAFSPRGRTAYPYTPASGHNPAISVTHFCVPAALLETLPPLPVLRS